MRGSFRSAYTIEGSLLLVSLNHSLISSNSVCNVACQGRSLCVIYVHGDGTSSTANSGNYASHFVRDTNTPFVRLTGNNVVVDGPEK